MLGKRINALNHLNQRDTQLAKNKSGQFATPAAIANEMVTFALAHSNNKNIRFLEPGFGSGTFFCSLSDLVAQAERTIAYARGYETDARYVQAFGELYKSTKLALRQEDFTKAHPAPFDILLCNPPYVRHHHLDAPQKKELAKQIWDRYQIRVSGLAGLYNYFMMIGADWLDANGIAGFLVPAEFMDVNYGVAVKSFLLDKVKLTRIHSFDNGTSQFDDALVSSVIVWYQKGNPEPEDRIIFSYGSSLLLPDEEVTVQHQSLDRNAKWSQHQKRLSVQTPVGFTETTIPRLKDFFTIKRGLATGDNDFFILSEDKTREYGIDTAFLKPMLPSPRYLKTDLIKADTEGMPLDVSRLYLLDCGITEEQLISEYPATWAYLLSGREKVSERYLCSSRKRWYFQEFRDAAPIVCTYMGRGSVDNEKPFRFILNESAAVATNSYLMLYPKDFWKEKITIHPSLLKRVWAVLSSLEASDLVLNGRSYGGGLKKMEPKELGNLPVTGLKFLLEHETTMDTDDSFVTIEGAA